LIHLDTQKTQEKTRTIAEKTTEIATTITSTIMARTEIKKKNAVKMPTSLTAISREPWQAVTRVIVHTVFTRFTVLTCVIDTFIDVF